MSKKKYLDGWDIIKTIDRQQSHLRSEYVGRVKMDYSKFDLYCFYNLTKSNSTPTKDRLLLNKIHEWLTNEYPNALIQDFRKQSKYAPEQVTLCVGVKVR